MGFPAIASHCSGPIPMYYDCIGYEMTLLEDIPFDELFHMMLSFLCAFYFQVDPHAADFLTRGISQEGFPHKRDFLIHCPQVKIIPMMI